MIDAIHIENLCILNDGTPTHDCRPSAVDLSVCTASIAARMEWEVLDEPFGPDHMGILIYLLMPLVTKQENRKRNLKVAQ